MSIFDACSAGIQLSAMKLTPKYIRKLIPDQDSQQVERVDASQQGLVQVGLVQQTLLQSLQTPVSTPGVCLLDTGCNLSGGCCWAVKSMQVAGCATELLKTRLTHCVALTLLA